MKPITQKTVLEAIPESGNVSFNSLTYAFVLDEERQYNRLEQTLEKLISQHKVEVIKTMPSLFDVMFANEEQKRGSMLRHYKFTRSSNQGV
jgi:hypothetical protein